MEYTNASNPVIESDFPDPDIIRVGDTYYMVCTSMYLMPGGDLLRSYDLLHWEFVCHIFDRLEDTPAHRLENGKNIFGLGMWAPSMRWNNGKFYVTFACNDTHTSYMFTADTPDGPWERRVMGDFFYDSSLFFDDDGRVYIVHGNGKLRLTELDPETWQPLKNGLDRVIVEDKPNQPLGYEGSHLYKFNGRYYLFTCHMPAGDPVIKTEDCFISDSLNGRFTGKEILRDDMGHRGLGVAQGGMVDTPDGNLYLFMFHDRGALGRSPVILPMEFDSDGYPAPVLNDGKLPREVSVPVTSEKSVSANLSGDLFLAENGSLMPYWQFSHNPAKGLYSFPAPNKYRIKTERTVPHLLAARNTLTQRCFGPVCEAYVTIDGSDLSAGDYAGMCLYTSAYAAIALAKDESGYRLVILNNPANDSSIADLSGYLFHTPVIAADCPVREPRVIIKARTDFRNMPDKAEFFFRTENTEWQSLGEAYPLYFKLDLFIGCRFGLFMYSTEESGGEAEFSDFRFKSE